MNIIKHKLARSQRNGFKRNGSDRNGLSVIEVLTSIVVALIGVFGVLAMIPFSVKQTQSGLDQDAATTMARNALADFEASGFNIKHVKPEASGFSSVQQLNWIDENNTHVQTGSEISLGFSTCSSLMYIDPLGVAERGGGATFPFHNDSFPNNALVLPLSPVSFRMPAVTLTNPEGTPFSLAEARRMFRLTDDLVFEQSDSGPDSDLDGPQQLFNEGLGGLLNRQSNGTVSWCAIVHPQSSGNAAPVENLKFYVLVFKDRVITALPDPSATDGKMAAALVTSPLNFTQAPTVTIADPPSAARFSDQVRRNDWVMLINRSAGSGSIASRTNVAFSRVANVSSNEAIGTSSLTLDGPDFLFTPPTPAEHATYLVHLKDVVAVFPRTIKLEDSSEWTVSAN